MKKGTYVALATAAGAAAWFLLGTDKGKTLTKNLLDKAKDLKDGLAAKL